MKKSKHEIQNHIYDAVINYFGSWQSISVIFLTTTGLVTNGLLRHIPLADGYWVVTNLFYSVMAILEAEIILMGQKRKSESDDARAEATYKLTRKTEKLVEHLIDEKGLK